MKKVFPRRGHEGRGSVMVIGRTQLMKKEYGRQKGSG